MSREFSGVRIITSSPKSPCVETIKADNVWKCKSVSKLKGLGDELETFK